MQFVPGSRAHVRGLGTGRIIETRGRDRYLLEIKGRLVVVPASALERPDDERRSRKARDRGVATAPVEEPAAGTLPSIDLHGTTTDQAAALVEEFINGALLAGHRQVHIIHGRSGGRVKKCVHDYLRQVTAIASFRLDPRNPGVTLVDFV